MVRQFFCVFVLCLLSFSSAHALTFKKGETKSFDTPGNTTTTVASPKRIPGKDMCKNMIQKTGGVYIFETTAEQRGCTKSDRKPYKDAWLEFSHSNRSEWLIKMPRKSGIWMFEADVSYDGDFGTRNTVFQVHDGFGKCTGACKHGSGKPPSWLGVTSGWKSVGLNGPCFFFSDNHRVNGNKCIMPAKKEFNLVVILNLPKFDEGEVSYIVDGNLLRTKKIKTRTGKPFQPHFGIYRINGQQTLTASYSNVRFEKIEQNAALNIIEQSVKTVSGGLNMGFRTRASLDTKLACFVANLETGVPSPDRDELAQMAEGIVESQIASVSKFALRRYGLSASTLSTHGEGLVQLLNFEGTSDAYCKSLKE